MLLSRIRVIDPTKTHNQAEAEASIKITEVEETMEGFTVVEGADTATTDLHAKFVIRDILLINVFIGLM